MLPELTQDEFSHTLDAVAADVLAAFDGEPPIDALKLAKAWGLDVAWDERQTARGRTARLVGRTGLVSIGSILLRPDPRRERLQWAIAHELGEWSAHRVFEQLSVDPREAPPASREAVANHLASRILLPRDAFEADARACDWDLPELKNRYATASHELIARRMLDFAPPVIVSVFDHGRRTFRKGNLPFRTPPMGEVEQIAWRACHVGAIATEQSDPTMHARAWPVHEPNWKREIMRTAWLASEDL